MTRCHDCLGELGDSPRAVIKVDTSREYSEEERKLSAHLFEAIVCEDCAGWYGEEFIEIEIGDARDPRPSEP